MDLLRFITAGNVDDGKSTLIGRLLYDSNAVSLDILEAIERSSKNKDKGELDLSLLTDGLRAEREQGITIDIAYKYFTTPKRKFIIADAPGHIQYTRNMVTGASTANLVIILIDARNGITEQTFRHSIVSSLLGIPHFTICVNKMDLVNYSQEVYDKIVADYKTFAAKLKLNVKELTFIPISAKNGDNIVDDSANMPWYKGENLLQHLEQVQISSDINTQQARFQVQYVIRPQSEAYHDYRGYAGKVISGVYKKGDAITVLPSGIKSRISKIELGQQELTTAYAQQSVIIHLADDIDISRGDTLVLTSDAVEATQELEATLCWMSEKPLKAGDKFLLQHNSKTTRAMVKEIEYKIEIHTLNQLVGQEQAQLNDICRVKIRTATPVVIDNYSSNRTNGGFILIDETAHATVAAGINEAKTVVADTDF